MKNKLNWSTLCRTHKTAGRAKHCKIKKVVEKLMNKQSRVLSIYPRVRFQHIVSLYSGHFLF